MLRCNNSSTGWLSLVGLLATMLSGCDLNDGRLSVSGTVTLAGEPLANGDIVFLPEGKGRSEAATITEGKYRIPSDRGLLPGTYRVSITAMRGVGKVYVDKETGVEDQNQEQFIAASYNDATELKCEVTTDSENTFDFEVTENEN